MVLYKTNWNKGRKFLVCNKMKEFAISFKFKHSHKSLSKESLKYKDKNVVKEFRFGGKWSLTPILGNVFLNLSYCNLSLIKWSCKKSSILLYFLLRISHSQKFSFQIIREKKSVSVFCHRAKDMYLETNENSLEQMHCKNMRKWPIIMLFKLF